MKKSSRYCRYTLIFTAPLLIAGAVLGLSCLILSRAGETIDPITAAQMQQSADIRYSSGLFYRPRPYKIERAKLAKADVILLGSSRAMQFVKEPWKVPAINAGGTMRDMESGEIFVNAVLDTYRPKQIIITLDWWWLSTTRRPDNPADASPLTPLTLHELTQPAVWLWDGTLSPSEFGKLLFARDALSHDIGVPALFKDAGWDPFGHYDYGSALTSPSAGSDVDFKATLDDIARTSKRNDKAPWHPFSEPNWQRLEALVKQLQEHDVETILVLPPVAPQIYDWLTSQPEPNLVNEIRRRLATLPVLTFDFHDPHSIGTDGCEFVDGIHGGEVTYLRALNSIAADPSSHLEEAVDRAMIERLIAENAGRATLKRDGRVPEADFNGLGCQK